MVTYETIMNIQKEYNHEPDWMSQMIKDETEYYLRCGFFKSTCAKCGKTFWHKPVTPYDDDKNYCDLCLTLRG